MNDIIISKDGVIKLLKGLNLSKALGPDELHPRVQKELATELGPVFAHLFYQSLDTGEIPKEWSLANICPFFKKTDRSFACNYRPVSLTCRGQVGTFILNFEKAFDTHPHERLKSKLFSYGIGGKRH